MHLTVGGHALLQARDDAKRRHIRTTPNCMSIARSRPSISSTFDSGNIKSWNDGHEGPHANPLDPLTELDKLTTYNGLPFARRFAERTRVSTAGRRRTRSITPACAVRLRGKVPKSPLTTSRPGAACRLSTIQRAERCAGSLTRRRSPSSALTLSYEGVQFVTQCAAIGHAVCASPRQSLEGREIDEIAVGDGPLHAWIIHRQHPGESQASFFAEGLLTRLLGLDHSALSMGGRRSRSLRGVVPMMNPDGVCRGFFAPTRRAT